MKEVAIVGFGAFGGFGGFRVAFRFRVQGLGRSNLALTQSRSTN